MTLLVRLAAEIPLQAISQRPVRSLPLLARKRKLRIAGITETNRLRERDLAAAFGGCDVTIRALRRGNA